MTYSAPCYRNESPSYSQRNTTYQPLATIKELSVPVTYSTIDGVSATKRDTTFYTKVYIPCVEPASQDVVVFAKGQRQLTDS
ncbi:hypothetical protein DSO57_1020461 [Entomophthora muscae]|uniref:Uncharacterized protein n=1 Tax=Entomophthora muscae TaxID=34485 RepID=A0ACC2U228_9FUNG|nr:hypothetical protein DSO57_1020461 [Entomophthora muscae]